MYHGVPEGYYSLAEVFNFLGKDTFVEDWGEIQKECSRYRLLHEISPQCEQYIFNKILNRFAIDLRLTQTYRQYTFFDQISKELCDIKAKELVADITCYNTLGSYLRLKDFIGTNLEPKDLEKFMQYALRCLLVKRRLLLMLEFTPLNVFIHDTKTEHMRELLFNLWRIEDHPRKENFSYDFFTGYGSYLFYENGMPQPYKGVLVVSKEAFDILRNERLENYRTATLFEIIKDLEDKLKEATTKNQKQIESSANDYTTPEFEAMKKVMKDYEITDTDQPRSEVAQYYFMRECPIKMSQNTLTTLATVTRNEEARSGGDPDSPLFKKHDLKFLELKELDEKNGRYLLDPSKSSTKKG